MFIDTHCHLNYSPLSDDIQHYIEAAQKAGVKRMICIGTDIDSSRQAIQIAENFPAVFVSTGIHPNDSAQVKAGWQMEVLELAQHPKVVAIGEIGLDYYRDHASPETQIRAFSEQIELAQELQLPLVIHNRRANEDVKMIIREHGYFHAVLHCYSSTAEYAEEMLDLGLHLSFTGNVTYGSRKTEKAVRATPLDRLMLETDAPFITPVPHKGQPNQPAYIPLIAAKIAELKQLSIEEVEQHTSETATRFFGLPQ